MDFFGREEELKLLEGQFSSNKSRIVAIYGRRRVGKSALIDSFIKTKRFQLIFEGKEKAKTNEQLELFTSELRKQLKNPYLKKFESWEEAFDYLTENVFNQTSRKQKYIFVLDELQWLAAGQSRLVALLKFYWDRYWQKQNIMLILCGSMASFMVKKVISSKALYGRISLQILLGPLQPNQGAQFFHKKRSNEEILKYFLIFGCIPKYLEEININESFNKNINVLCFSRESFFYDEVNKIFYSQFKETKIYLDIVKAVSIVNLSAKEIGQAVKFKGGSIKFYLDNLVAAQIISEYIPIGSPENSRLKKYKLTDEFLVFYFKYIKPNLSLIKQGSLKKLFEKTCENQWQPWLGYAFERFCLKNALYLAKIMGFDDDIIGLGSYRQPGLQVDLLYKRADKTYVLSEIKYKDQEITTEIIPEIEGKIKLFKLPKGYSLEKALICVHGASAQLKASRYFDYIVSVDDIIKG